MSQVRVRIAPSPTGHPHVGTAYIALFNSCFARSNHGKFVLRIEDTDQERSDPAYETMILDALRWVGLQWDEGPDVGGAFGPYRQSERTDIYRKHADQLIEQGHAYPCFCSAERLAEIRTQRFQDGLTTGYDGHCASIPAAEASQRVDSGQPHTLRLRVPAGGSLTVHDPLRGDIEFDYATVDHQILIKSDGFPTYHLANVVDDHLMKISHVIRGEEWLPSLPKHLLLYEAFGWDPPIVYHLPLLRNEDKSKLSKRKNPTSILYYRDLGILPETLLNFLGLMAYSMPDGREIFSLDEMVEDFDIQRMSLGGPVFDQQKLTWLNQQQIAALDPSDLLGRLLAWKLNPKTFARLLPLVHKRMHRLGDFIELCDFVFVSNLSYETDLLPPKKRELEETRDQLQKLIWHLEKLRDFHESEIQRAFQDIAELTQWSLRELTHAARVAISGKTVAPPLFGVMEVMGSDLCRNRLMQAVTAIGPLGKKKLAKLQKEYTQQIGT